MSNDLAFENANKIYSKITDGTHDSPKRQESGKPLITSKHIKGRNIDFETAYLISEEDFVKVNQRSQVEKWDVIVSMIGEYCGYCLVERNDNIDYAVKNVGLYKTGSKLEAEWLYYYLNSPIGKAHLNKVKSGSSQPYLTLGGLRDLPILQPKQPQIKQSITKALSDIDTKIELNNKINEQLESMAKLIYDYWFVQFDFPYDFAQGKPDENGKPYKSSGGKMVFNEKLKREIPEGWEVKELSDIANITMGQSPSGSSYNESNEGTVFFQGSTDFGWRFPSIRQYTTEPSRLAKKGDVLLSVRAPVGTLNIADNDCCIGRGLASLNSKNNADTFLFYVMVYFKQVFDRRNSVGTTFGSITKDDLHSLKLVFPKVDILKDYDNKVSVFNTKILNNHKQNQKLTKLRDWLLPMLMNGQVSVD